MKAQIFSRGREWQISFSYLQDELGKKGLKTIKQIEGLLLNRPFSYSRYRTGTSLQFRLMRVDLF